MLTPHAPPTDKNAHTIRSVPNQPGLANGGLLLSSSGFSRARQWSSRRPARTAGRTTRAMSSSVNSDDMRPLVNSESLPSVSPVNLLGASSSYFVRMDNAHPRLYKPALRALRLSQRC